MTTTRSLLRPPHPSSPAQHRPSPWSRWSVRVPAALLAVLVCTLVVLVLAGQDLDGDALDVLLLAGALGTTVAVLLLRLVDDVRATPREARHGVRTTAAYAVFATGSTAAVGAGLVAALAVGLAMSAWLDDNFIVGPSTLTVWQGIAVHAAALGAGCAVVASVSHTSAELALRLVRGRWAAAH